MASFLKLIYSQCDGCNDQFQSIDLWNLKYNCSKFLENYNDCNSLKFTELFTDNLLLNNFEFGSQNWIDGKLDYFYLFDNRYKINDSTLLDLVNVKYLF